MSVLAKSILKLFGGSKSEKDVKLILPIVDQINEQFEKTLQLDPDALRAKTIEFQNRIKEGIQEINDSILALNKEAKETKDIHHKEELFEQVDKLQESKNEALENVLNDILPEAFAVVKATAKLFTENEKIEVTPTELDKKLVEERDYITANGEKVIYANRWIAAGAEVIWNMVHYDVQLIGGTVLHQGKIAEMATGEGKTLVATLPAYLNGLTGEGVHIITVNDYLARRDSEWMRPIFEFLGLTVDCIDKYEPNSEERREAYRANVTYGTNNEFGFDYLRDNMVMNMDQRVQGRHHYSMVDEVDSVLIDDARTPLIISGPTQRADQQEYYTLKPKVSSLVEAQKKITQGYLLEAKRLIAEGKDGEKEGGLALLRAHRGLPKNKALIKYLSEPGIKAKLLKTESYYLRDQQKEMPIVDDALYFVIDEQGNSVDLTDKGIDLIAKDADEKDLFVLPNIGEVIADLEKSELEPQEIQKKKDSLFQDYSVKTERLHSIQQLLKAYALFEKDVEYVVMDSKVKIVDEQTGRIMDGRRYSDGLHQAIEAKENVKVEAATQTHATVTLQNYFRMYHKLAGMTGTAETEAGEFWEIYKLDVVVIPTNRPIQRDDKNDLIYRTAREKYGALIDEAEVLRNAGRPILIGTTSVEISEKLSRMLKMKGIPHNILNAKQHQSEAQIVADAGKEGQVTIATNMAGRGTDIKINQKVIDAGGLAILGSERHDSRRVDRQLRGRAGRQGDAGSSVFYVSLEDNLMRLFGSERIAKVMDRLGYKEGEVIQHSMITKSIERAQKKVEENNFGMRKKLLEYDDVMNSQRELIYKKRRHALSGERLNFDIQSTFYELCADILDTNRANEDYENFKEEALMSLSLEAPFTEEEFKKGNFDEMVEELFQKANDTYIRKSQTLAEVAYPVIKDVYETRGDTVNRIVVPFTDGKKTLNVPVELELAYNSQATEVVKAFEKTITLALIDEAWKEHLRMMDDLKQAVRTASYEQKDPLLIYKFEGFKMFKEMLAELNKDLANFLIRGIIPVENPNQIKQASRPSRSTPTGIKAGRGEAIDGGRQQTSTNAQESSRTQTVVSGPKVGRNDPCPCGSGKKFKKCHGINAEA